MYDLFKYHNTRRTYVLHTIKYVLRMTSYFVRTPYLPRTCNLVFPTYDLVTRTYNIEKQPPLFVSQKCAFVTHKGLFGNVILSRGHQVIYTKDSLTGRLSSYIH